MRRVIDESERLIDAVVRRRPRTISVFNGEKKPVTLTALEVDVLAAVLLSDEETGYGYELAQMCRSRPVPLIEF
jgi:hypothetical protein